MSMVGDPILIDLMIIRIGDLMRRCEYCKRFFKNKHGLAIHLAFCKIKKLQEYSQSMRKDIVGIHTVTPYPDVDNKVRNMNL